ncbi:MAG: tetratricopeptide repeat protein, partial [Pseudomonadota bacterium]
AEAAPDREEAGAREPEAAEAKAEEDAEVKEAKEAKKKEKEEKKEVPAEAEKKVIGKVEIRKVPVEIISKGPDAPAEKLTPKKGVIIGEKAAGVREKKGADDEDTVRKRVEEAGAGTIKTEAPSIPSKPAKEEKLPARMKEGRVEEEVLSAIDSKIQQLKEGKEARKEEAEKGEEEPKEEGREAPTARMYSADAAKEKDVEEALKEKLTARWTFPVSDSGVIEEKLKEKAAKEKAMEEGREEEKEEEARKEGKQIIEEEPAKQEDVRKGMVQAISLNEVKEEIEKREKDGKEKKDEKKKEMSESGAYSVEDKEFFRSAPTGDEPVDTFDDLDFGGKGKKEESTKGLTYAIWTIILLGIAGVLFLVFGKDLLKQGPDLTLLDKLEKAEPVETKPLMEKSMEELSPMEGEEEGATEGEKTAPQPGQEEGEGEEQATPAAEGTEEAAEGTEEAAEGTEEAAEGTEEAAEGTEEGMEPEPPVASDGGAYAALLAEARDLMAKKKKKDAIDRLKESVKANPNGQEALSMLVDIFKEKPTPEVLAWGQKATQLGPNDTQAWFGYGLALFTKGKTAEAKPVFEHCIEIKPPDSNTGNCRKMLKWCK